MTNKTLRCPGDIVQANAQTDLLDDLVCILLIDVILNGLHALLVEVLGCNLNQVCNFCLSAVY